MTLHRFLAVTASVPDRDLRRAMGVALWCKVPRHPEDYQWYYRRVIRVLDAWTEMTVEPTPPETELAACCADDLIAEKGMGAVLVGQAPGD